MKIILYFVLFTICATTRLTNKRPFLRANVNFINSTVYLGYTNDPFGPSIRFQNKKNSHFDFPAKQKLPSREANKHSKTRTERSKRGVFELYNMVSCATGCNPLIYKGYGCYCGFLGSGYAVDGIDRCCKIHDWCYDSANCPMFLEYFVPYYWTCFQGRPLCAIDHGEWGGSGSCAQRLCECDKRLSQCLSDYPCPSNRAICRSAPLRLIQNAFMFF